MDGIGVRRARLADFSPRQVRRTLNLIIFFRAQAYRKIGEIYESFHDIGNPIINFELALKFNPNVGVKKKLQLLRDKNM